MGRPLSVAPTAELAAEQLAHSGHVFVDYNPGDGTNYRLLLAFGPRIDELTVAWPSYGRAVVLPFRAGWKLDSDYIASKMFHRSANERYEHEQGPITQLVNAINDLTFNQVKS